MCFGRFSAFLRIFRALFLPLELFGVAVRVEDGGVVQLVLEILPDGGQVLQAEGRLLGGLLRSEGALLFQMGQLVEPGDGLFGHKNTVPFGEKIGGALTAPGPDSARRCRGGA